MWKILQTSNFEQAIITCGAYKAVALYHYLQPSDSLPDPSGPLSVSVSPAPIKDANEPVRSATRSKPRGKCAVKFNFIIFQRSWESRWRLLRFRLGKERAWLKLASRGKLVIWVSDLVTMHRRVRKEEKNFSEGLTAVYMKICTSWSFPLYSTLHCLSWMSHTTAVLY